LKNPDNFSRQYRLVKPGQYSRVFQGKPKKSYDHCFTILAQPNDSDPARLGLAVAKKSVRKAVQRNRIKRIVRDSFRHARHNLPAMDYVVLVKRGIDLKNNQAIFDSLESHWQRFIRRHSASAIE